jgi:enoyl-CoA hydratase/carnithine racemase
VNRLAKEGETLSQATVLAQLIARRAPVATRLIIQAVDDGLNTDIDAGLKAETRAFLEVLKTEDAAEGIQAFLQKREPQFKGR